MTTWRCPCTPPASYPLSISTSQSLGASINATPTCPASSSSFLSRIGSVKRWSVRRRNDGRARESSTTPSEMMALQELDSKSITVAFLFSFVTIGFFSQTLGTGDTTPRTTSTQSHPHSRPASQASSSSFLSDNDGIHHNDSPTPHKATRRDSTLANSSLNKPALFQSLLDTLADLPLPSSSDVSASQTSVPIPITSPASSPPLVSRPVFSFAKFNSGTRGSGNDDGNRDRQSTPEILDLAVGDTRLHSTPYSTPSNPTLTAMPIPIPESPPHPHNPEPEYNYFSYGYGHTSPTLPTSSSAARGGPGSGLAQAIRRTLSPTRHPSSHVRSPSVTATTASSPNRKRLSAPLTFTRLSSGEGSQAPPVVDLGMTRSTSTAIKGVEMGESGEVIWTRWDLYQL